MDDQRPRLVPALDEVDQRGDVIVIRQHQSVGRRDDIVDADEEMVLGGIVSGRSTGVARLMRVMRWLAPEAATVGASWERGQT